MKNAKYIHASDIMDEFVRAYVITAGKGAFTCFGEIIPPSIPDISPAYRKALSLALLEAHDNKDISFFLSFSNDFFALVRKSAEGIANIEYKDVLRKAIESYFFKHNFSIVDSLLEEAVERDQATQLL